MVTDILFPEWNIWTQFLLQTANGLQYWKNHIQLRQVIEFVIILQDHQLSAFKHLYKPMHVGLSGKELGSP